MAICFYREKRVCGPESQVKSPSIVKALLSVLRMTKCCARSKKKKEKKEKGGKKGTKLKKEEEREDRRRNTEGGLSLVSGRLVREIRPLGKASCIACLRLPVIIIRAVSQDGHGGTEQPFGRDVQ